MSNIEQILQKILSSRYGKDVRQSIHDGIKQLQADVNSLSEETFVFTETIDSESEFDANTAFSNKCYTIDVSSNYQLIETMHIPETRGLLITFNSRYIEDYAYTTQLFSSISSSNKLYWRVNKGSLWSEWKNISDELSFTETEVIDSDSDFDANYAIPNKCYTIDISDNAELITEYNIPESRGLLISFNSRIIENYAYTTQLFNTLSGDNYIRVCDGFNWTDWKKILKEKEKNVVCLNSAEDIYNAFKSGVSNTKFIINPGVYDIYTGLIENDILSDTAYEFYFGDNIEIIGNNATIECNVPENVERDHHNACLHTSPINVRYNISIRDLNINISNIRYCIHDESLDLTKAYYSIHKYKNIKLTTNTTVSDLFTRPIGIGGSLGQDYIFENCIFDANREQASSFYIHGRGYNIGSITIDSCVIRNNGKFSFSQYTGNNIPTNVIIKNTSAKYIEFGPQEGGSNLCQYVAKIFNSGNPTILKTGTFDYIEDPEIIDFNY